MRNHSFVFLCGLLAFLVACSAEPEEKTQTNTPSITVHTTVTIDEEAPVAPAVTPDTAKALPFRYLKTESGKVMGKKIVDRYIQLLPDPDRHKEITPQLLKQTAAKAALILQEEDPHADMIHIWIVPSKEFIGKEILMRVFYTSEGKDAGNAPCPVWDFSGTSRTLSISDYYEIEQKGLYGK